MTASMQNLQHRRILINFKKSVDYCTHKIYNGAVGAVATTHK